jgi:hypothetical protein
MICHCNNTILDPPIPCGTRIACSYPCSRPSPPCGHPSTQHTCHEDPIPCPPCPFLTSKTCACGKNTVGNVKCSQERVSCGVVCGKYGILFITLLLADERLGRCPADSINVRDFVTLVIVGTAPRCAVSLVNYGRRFPFFPPWDKCLNIHPVYPRTILAHSLATRHSLAQKLAPVNLSLRLPVPADAFSNPSSALARVPTFPRLPLGSSSASASARLPSGMQSWQRHWGLIPM